MRFANSKTPTPDSQIAMQAFVNGQTVGNLTIERSRIYPVKINLIVPERIQSFKPAIQDSSLCYIEKQAYSPSLPVFSATTHVTNNRPIPSPL